MEGMEKLITNNKEELVDYLMKHVDEDLLEEMDFEEMELAVHQVVKGVGKDLLQELVKKKVKKTDLKI